MARLVVVVHAVGEQLDHKHPEQEPADVGEVGNAAAAVSYHEGANVPPNPATVSGPTRMAVPFAM